MHEPAHQPYRARAGCRARDSRAEVHRIACDIVCDIVRHIAAIALVAPVDPDRRHSWIVDGTLVPTRDHHAAGKAKNYPWSCNAQVLVRRCDLRVVAVAGGDLGNRNDPVHYRGSEVEQLCDGTSECSQTAAIAALPS